MNNKMRSKAIEKLERMIEDGKGIEIVRLYAELIPDNSLTTSDAKRLNAIVNKIGGFLHPTIPDIVWFADIDKPS